MKFSQFNTTIERKDDLLIYNSFSGALIKIPKKKMHEAEPLLIKNRMLIHDDENEVLTYQYIYYNSIFNSKDLSITIAPTTDCNLCCPYCFEAGHRHKEYMDEALLNSIAEYLCSKKKKAIHITWFGGEPLLCFDKMLELSRRLTAQGLQFTSSIITNGTLLNQRVIEQLPELNLTSVQITLDGDKNEHDKKRFFSNKNGTFNLINKNIDNLLNGSNIPIIIKINIDKNNYISCMELIGSLKEKYKCYIAKKRIEIITNYIRNITNFKGSEACLSENEYYNISASLNKPKPELPKLCLACPLRSPNDIIIGPDGNIYKCLEFIGDKTKSIGNIKTHSLSLSSLAQTALSHNPFDDPKCLSCSILPICGGGCPNSRARKEKGEDVSVCSPLKDKVHDMLNAYLNQAMSNKEND